MINLEDFPLIDKWLDDNLEEHPEIGLCYRADEVAAKLLELANVIHEHELKQQPNDASADLYKGLRYDI